MENKDILLEVKGLKKYFPLQKNLLGKPKIQLRAVDDISFILPKGKTLIPPILWAQASACAKW